MLIDAHDLQPGHVLEGDVVIVGAGACGITLAHLLARAGAEVVLLEGGGKQYTQSSQDLYQGPAEGTCLEPGSAYLSATRLRYLGGTTNHWAGWCRPLDPVDFERRDWIADSGWPIAYEEFEAHIPAAAAILETLPFPESPDPDYGAWSLFDRSTIAVKRIFHFSPPVRFRLKYGRELETSDRIRLVLEANVLNLRLEPEGGRVAAVEAASQPGRPFTARGRLVVLAAGGIENARLLLASNGVRRRGLGNEHDLVGRFFMDHPHRRLGTVLLWEPPPDLRAYRSPKDDSQRRMPTIALSEDYRRRQGLLGASLQLVQRQRADPDDDLVRAIAGLRALAEETPEPERRPLEAIVNIRAEQSPNRESRVRLDEDVDRFGLPRARLDWRLADQDLRTLTETARVMGAELARTGVGRLRALIDPENPWRGTVGGEHHLGTTRMAASPRAGVVDSNCRLFDVDNLYVAGSSVFTTAGYVNPTFSLVTLAVRLARHLQERLSRS